MQSFLFFGAGLLKQRRLRTSHDHACHQSGPSVLGRGQQLPTGITTSKDNGLLYGGGTASCFFPWANTQHMADPGPSEGIREEAISHNKFQLVALMERTCCELPESRNDLQTKSQFMVFIPISI